ncbi:hypothetical protein IKI14_00205 [bacterium]|nr:hypothetical protein [bacterium]
MAILKDSFGRIKEFQDEIGNDSDSRLQALNNTLTNIQKVLDHPTKVYRNQLLNFIYETCYKNLDSDDLKRR